jgi:SNF2 family DNA or RNA helicase
MFGMSVPLSLTDYHTKYYAYELTRRYSADSLEKLASTFASAKVDLNPHQLDAALFAFGSPPSRGALLADEVGLGKTIEAGLVISQKWAERNRVFGDLKSFREQFAKGETSGDSGGRFTIEVGGTKAGEGIGNTTKSTASLAI